MKKILIKMAMLILKKYRMQSLEISLEMPFLFENDYYQIDSLSQKIASDGHHILSFSARRIETIKKEAK